MAFVAGLDEVTESGGEPIGFSERPCRFSDLENVAVAELESDQSILHRCDVANEWDSDGDPYRGEVVISHALSILGLACQLWEAVSNAPNWVESSGDPASFNHAVTVAVSSAGMVAAC